jgi:hypothetical protein
LEGPGETGRSRFFNDLVAFQHLLEGLSGVS